jgi:thiol-disulfide isomerase/thioredoxin
MNRAERRQPSPSRAQEQARAKRRQVALYASLAVLAVVLIVTVALMSRVPKTASDAPITAPIAVGQPAPPFAVSTTAGPFDLAQNGGKPTLLEVFATWCPHCQHETAIMNSLYAKFKGKVNIVAVSGSDRGMDNSSPASPADMMNFVQTFKVAYPIAYDGDMTVAKAYLQSGYPTIALIGADKKILALGGGEISEASLATAMGNALAGKPVNPTFGQPAG